MGDMPDDLLKLKLEEMQHISEDIVERQAEAEKLVRKFEERHIAGMSDAKWEEYRIRQLIKQNQADGVAELSKSRKVNGIWFAAQKANKNCKFVCEARGLKCDPKKFINNSEQVDTRAKVASIFEDLELPCKSVTMQDRMESKDMKYLPARRTDGAWCES